MAHAFQGFSPELFEFLRGLERDNTKAYFDAHRDVYDRAYVAPAREFVVALGGELQARVSPGIQAEPKVNGSIFRINRDTRFSRDKTPYKPHLDMFFWEGEGRSRELPGFYLRLTPEVVHYGAGMHGFPKDRLDAYRQAVADDARGAALEDAIASVGAAGATVGGGDAYKRVPRGYEAEGARADLLRHGALFAGEEAPLPDEVGGEAFVAWTADRMAPLAPVHRWLVQNIT